MPRVVELMRTLYDQYQYNVSRSEYYQDEQALPDTPPASPAVRLIAYYLPQFHAIAENNAWWGAGFTEWTNVSKALPRYVGHEQPRMPSDLGFYDLTNVDTIRRQVDMARRGGIDGFCIHNYWFSGRKLLERPLEIILANPDIDINFCLNWANENWTRRWDGLENDILLEQRHAPGEDVAYAESILPALRDPRYIHIDGRPLLMIYRPQIIPNISQLVKNWRAYFIAAGVGDPYLVMAQTFGDNDPRPYGLDAAVGFPPHNSGFELRDKSYFLRTIDRKFSGRAVAYAKMVDRTLSAPSPDYQTFPGVCPRWDNEARKPGRGVSLFGTSPRLYGEWLKATAERVLQRKSADERIVFINAWNEWAEGAYLEPDLHHGYAYLAETRRALDAVGEDQMTRPAVPAPVNPYAVARPSVFNLLRNLPLVFRKIRNNLKRK